MKLSINVINIIFINFIYIFKNTVSIKCSKDTGTHIDFVVISYN